MLPLIKLSHPELPVYLILAGWDPRHNMF